MSPPRIEFSLRNSRWLVPAAALILMPKCLLCVLTYAGAATLLGFGGPELCGGAPGTSDLVNGWKFSISDGYLAAGVIAGLIGLRHRV